VRDNQIAKIEQAKDEVLKEYQDSLKNIEIVPQAKKVKFIFHNDEQKAALVGTQISFGGEKIKIESWKEFSSKGEATEENRESLWGYTVSLELSMEQLRQLCDRRVVAETFYDQMDLIRSVRVNLKKKKVVLTFENQANRTQFKRERSVTMNSEGKDFIHKPKPIPVKESYTTYHYHIPELPLKVTEKEVEAELLEATGTDRKFEVKPEVKKIFYGSGDRKVWSGAVAARVTVYSSCNPPVIFKDHVPRIGYSVISHDELKGKPKLSEEDKTTRRWETTKKTEQGTKPSEEEADKKGKENHAGRDEEARKEEGAGEQAKLTSDSRAPGTDTNTGNNSEEGDADMSEAMTLNGKDSPTLEEEADVEMGEETSRKRKASTDGEQSKPVDITSTQLQDGEQSLDDESRGEGEKETL